jgi:hypothetical protein
MCRYEGAELVDEELVDNRGLIFQQRFGEDPDQHNVYLFTIESPECVVGRWASFGISPKKVV